MQLVYFFGGVYSLNKNIGKSYNQYIEMLPNDNSWACFFDGDACFLTPNYGHQITHIVNKYPETGMFTCITNRVGNLNQCFRGQISADADIKTHRRLAHQIQLDSYEKVKESKSPISGIMMCIKKSTWRNFPFAGSGILQVDNDISRRLIKAGKKILIMEGVYLFHYYRLLEGGRSFKQHLKK